jgi:hypothetical protein
LGNHLTVTGEYDRLGWIRREVHSDLPTIIVVELLSNRFAHGRHFSKLSSVRGEALVASGIGSFCCLLRLGRECAANALAANRRKLHSSKSFLVGLAISCVIGCRWLTLMEVAGQCVRGLTDAATWAETVNGLRCFGVKHRRSLSA